MTQTPPETPTERTAIILYFLLQRGQINLTEAAGISGMTRRGADKLLERISRQIPIYDEGQTWLLVEDPTCKPNLY